ADALLEVRGVAAVDADDHDRTRRPAIAHAIELYIDSTHLAPSWSIGLTRARIGPRAPRVYSIRRPPARASGQSSKVPMSSQDAQKGPDARRRPTAAREAYRLWLACARHDFPMRSPRLWLRLANHERAAEGANEADGPFSASRAVAEEAAGL